MSCDRYRDAIVDHACGAEIASDAAAHLECCASCQQAFEQQARAIEGLDRELQAALAVEPSPRFVSETMARAQESRSSRLYGTWWLGVAAAAAVVLVTIGLLNVNERQPEVEGGSTVAQSSPSPVPPEPLRRESPKPPDRTNTGSSTHGAVNRARVVAATKRHGTPTATVAKTYQETTFRDVSVLIPPGQAEGLSRYLTLVRRGALVPPAAAQAAHTEISISEPVIAPLSVQPLNVAEMTPDTAPGTNPGTNKE